MIFTFLSIIILLFSVSLHEAAHGFVAYRMGDPSAKYADRITLNPLKHIDPMGSIFVPGLMLLLTRGRGPVFGWAKPVPINPNNFRDRNRGEVLSALAGPVSNLLLGTLSGIAARFMPVTSFGFYVASATALTNFALALFNLIPIPPLDGSHVLLNLWPGKRWRIERFLKTYGTALLIAFLFFGLDLIAPLIRGLFYLVVGKGLP